jgi:hypothetical protein
LLAVCETVVASAIALFVAIVIERPFLVVLPAAVAPLLLLRTEWSTALGLRWWDRVQRFARVVDAFQEKPRPHPLLQEACLHLGFLVFITTLPPLAIICRVGATIAGLVRHPFHALSSIPRNWYRIALCVDTFHPPEIVAGLELRGQDDRFRYSRHLKLAHVAVRRWHSTRPKWWRALYGLGWIAQLVLLFVPSFVYRWSLKATTVIWLPLIYVVRERSGGRTLRQWVNKLVSDPSEKVVRLYAGVVAISAFGIPFLLSRTIGKHVSIGTDNPLAQSLSTFWFFTGDIRWWHVMRMLNIIVVFAVWKLSYVVIERLEYGMQVNELAISRAVNLLLAVRSCFGVVLGGTALYEIATAVDWHITF